MIYVKEWSLPMFFSKRFMVSGPTFKSLPHLEFIFVYDIREYSNFILLHVPIELPHDPAIPFPVIHKKKTLIQKDTLTSMFMRALFTVAKIWKQANCPSTDKCIEKMWYKNIMENYSSPKRIKYCHL